MRETSEVEGGKGRTARPYEQAVLAGLKLALQLCGLTAYGWFRDELYYVACSEHLAWGYVEDEKPIWIARRMRRPWSQVWMESKRYE